MANCVRTPTATIFTTSTYSTVSVSTSISNEVNTATDSTVLTTTRCDVEATPSGSGGPTCVSSTVITTTIYSTSVTTIPHTSLTTVPVFVPQTTPIQTLYAPCSDDDTPSDPTPTPTPSTAVTTYTSTSYILTTDERGTHTSSVLVTGTSSGLNSGGKSGSSSPNIPAIVGGVVGGTLGLIAIIALVWYLLWRREQMKDLFDDDDDEDTFHGLKPRGVMMRDGRRGRRSLNLDDEVKSETNHPYQYGVVGSISPSPKPGMHSQQSSVGYQHRRSGSRDALMRSGAPSPPSVSPQRLSAHLPSTGSQGRASYNSSTRPDSVMMNQPMNPHHQWNSEDTHWTQPPRPSSSLLEAPNVYPPGHNGFYQQYGPMESIPSQTQVNHGQANNAQPTNAAPLIHQALYEAAGLGTASPPAGSSAPVTALPPSGAGGARPYTEWRTSDIQSAVMAGADRAAASASPPPTTGGSGDVGFGRQRVEKSPRVERVTSPVVQHQDAGRVPDTESNPTPSNANANSDAPPAYSQS